MLRTAGRNFDADELVAFAVPLTWFFMPPPPWSDQPGVPVKLSTPDAERFGTTLALLVDLVFGDQVQAAELSLRLDSFLDQLGSNPLTRSQERFVAAVNTRIEALVSHSFEGIGRWQTMLRGIANQLEDLERRAKGRTREEEGLIIDELVARHLGPSEDEDEGQGRTGAEGDRA